MRSEIHISLHCLLVIQIVLLHVAIVVVPGLAFRFGVYYLGRSLTLITLGVVQRSKFSEGIKSFIVHTVSITLAGLGLRINIADVLGLAVDCLFIVA